MTEITWTNCAEQMPPWMMHVIMHNTAQKIPRYECMTGYALWFYFRNTKDLSSIAWTAYTGEKLAYILNNLCDASHQRKWEFLNERSREKSN